MRSCQFYLLGGPAEDEQLEIFIQQVPGSIKLTRGYSLEEELAIMAAVAW